MRTVRYVALAGLGIFALAACMTAPMAQTTKAAPKYPLVKSNAEWKKILTPEAYHILREQGTERAFSGKYWNWKDKGIFVCAGCDLPLFSTDTKFDSGTGWPSFYKPINNKAIVEIKDVSYGMTRVEVVCSRCGGHQGHVFEDGPKPTGLRYCINSPSIKFKKAGTK